MRRGLEAYYAGYMYDKTVVVSLYLNVMLNGDLSYS